MRFRTDIFRGFLVCCAVLVAPLAWSQTLQWGEVPDLPRAQSGHVAGTHDGALIVAGGASFPTSPFQGGEKVYHGDIYVLESRDGDWQNAGALESPRAYGAAVSTGDGVILAGGMNGTETFNDVVRLAWVDGTLSRETLPDLPEPCAMTSAALLDDTLYVAGGQTTTDASQALLRFWALDLSAENLQWQTLDPWPGPSRILPVMTAQDGAVYLFSGADLVESAAGEVVRNYLSDGYRYRPDSGWETISGPPNAVTAAPVATSGQAHIFVFGGDDGSLAEQVQELGDDHPGFSHDVFAYHTVTDTWTVRGELPEALVTSSAVWWNDEIVIPGGEDRPGHRSATAMTTHVISTTPNFGIVNSTVVGVYFALLIAMGAYFARRENTTADYFLAGKRVPWWAMGLSIFGTQLSAITYLAIPARAYATDWIYMWANSGIILIAPFVVLFILPHYHRSPYTTAYEFLEDRFNVATRIYGSLVFLLFQGGRVGIVLFLPAIALNAVTGFNVYMCILIMGILATLYTVLGGIEAVIWTDVAQVVVLSFGVILSTIIIIANVDGGLSDIVTTANAAGKFHALNWTWDVTTAAVWVCLVGNFFAVAYPYTADQTVVQRYLASASEKDAARATYTNAILAIPATFFFFSVGTGLYVFYKHHPELLDPTLQNDAIFAQFIVQQLPIGISGLVVAAVFAAAMSSLDSSLNSAATVVVNDFYKRFKQGITDHHALLVARGLTILFGAIGTVSALVMAWLNVPSLFEHYNRILGLTGGGLAGLLVLGMFTKRANGTGALIGALLSAVAVYLVRTYTPVHLFLYGAVGFFTSFIVGYAASLIVGQDSESKTTG